MRYYVTGSHGFIGENLIKHLNNMGEFVIRVDRNDFDIKFTDEPHSFIHLSAYGNHYNKCDYSNIIKANVEALDKRIRSLKLESLNKFYNFSSSSVTLTHQTVYSLSKLLGEMIINDIKTDSRYISHYPHGHKFVNIRPYSVFGPGEAAHRFIPTVIRALHSGETIQLDEHARHDWIYVDDFISGMFAGHTLVGSGKSYTNLDIVWMLELISGKKLNYEPAKLRSYDTDNWVCPHKDVPCRPIEEGLKQTYEFYKAK